MKYRRLQIAELEAVQEDFIKFLAANSVTGPDWEKLKEENSEGANTLLDLFSDIFWDKALSNIKYLQQRLPQAINVYCFEKDKAEVISFQTNNKKISLEDDALIDALAQGLMDVNELEIDMYRGKKNYKKEAREAAIFELIEKGATPCKAPLFLAFQKLTSL